MEKTKITKELKNKILIIDDDDLFSEIYAGIFKKEGYEIQILSDVTQAEETMREFRPDVILLDLLMPKSNGFDFLNIIKRSPDFKDIPVIVVSSLSQEEYINTCKDLGASAYMVKSKFTTKEIVEVANKLVMA